MDLPNPGIKLGSPALQTYSLTTELSGKPAVAEEPIFIKTTAWNSLGQNITTKTIVNPQMSAHYGVGILYTPFLLILTTALEGALSPILQKTDLRFRENR